MLSLLWNNVKINFWLFLFIANKKNIKLETDYTTLPILNQKNKNLLLACPPVEEQKKLHNTSEAETKRIDTKKKNQKLIDLLTGVPHRPDQWGSDEQKVKVVWKGKYRWNRRYNKISLKSTIFLKYHFKTTIFEKDSTPRQMDKMKISMSLTTEKTFETALVQHLVENGGYAQGDASHTIRLRSFL